VKIDLNSGAFIEIGGELGKYNSLPIDVLIKLAQDLQELVYTLAKYDLPAYKKKVIEKKFKIFLIFSKSTCQKIIIPLVLQEPPHQSWHPHPFDGFVYNVVPCQGLCDQ
jgi:hypothetical protein